MDSELRTMASASWPADLRAALIVFINVDAPGLEHVTGSQIVDLDYTATGFQRLLTMLADLDVSATMAWTPRALSSFPQLARRARDHGHELALSRATPGDNGEDESVLSHISDVSPRGRIERLPGHDTSTRQAAEAVGAVGGDLTWTVTGVSGDLPISTMHEGRSGPAIIPVSPYWIDTAWIAPDRPLPPSSLLEAWSLSLSAVRAEGGLMTIVLHPHLSGRPGIAGQIQRFLDEAIESGDVWIATSAQVAEWWHQHEQRAPRR